MAERVIMAMALGLLLLTTTVIHAQPQYRVFVDSPATFVSLPNTPNDVTDFQVSICARELDSRNTDTAYCPLGSITLPINSDFPRMFLDFGEGSDTLAGPYPTVDNVIQGIGLVVGIGGTRNGAFEILGIRLIRRHTVKAGGSDTTGFTPIDAAGVFNVNIGVECLPGYSGIDCNTFGATTLATTTGEQPTTEQPTTEQPTTEQPTTEQPTTEQSTTEQPTTEQTTLQEPMIATTEEPTSNEQPTTEQPTTEQPTTEQPTTEQPTTEQPTEQPTTEELTTEEPETSLATPSPSGEVGNQCVDRNAMAPIYAGIGVGVATILLVHVLTVALVWIIVRRRRSSSDSDNGVSQVPVYGEVKNPTYITGESKAPAYDEAKNPVYVTRARECQEYEDVNYI